MSPREPATSQLLAIAALLAVISGNIVGNLLLKIGAAPAANGFRLFGQFGWPTLVGLVCYGSGFFLYAWALRYVDLHIAQIVVSLQFAGTILVAWLYFGEAIGPQQWIGLSFIFLGLLICAR